MPGQRDRLVAELYWTEIVIGELAEDEVLQRLVGATNDHLAAWRQAQVDAHPDLAANGQRMASGRWPVYCSWCGCLSHVRGQCADSHTICETCAAEMRATAAMPEVAA